MEIKNLAIIQGNSAKIKEGHIKYAPVDIKNAEKKLTKNEENINIDQVVLRSDTYFNSGKLEFTLKTKNYDTGALLIFTTLDGRQLRCGYSRTWKTFIIAIEDGHTWKSLSNAGKLEDFELDVEIKFQVTVNGSQINLFINNIILCSANIPIKLNPVEFEIWSSGEFEIYNIIKHSSKPKAFIVMQFSQEYNELYEDVIRPVTEKFGYECVRADEYYTGTPILNDIIKSIKDSSIVIAEITPDNPNVFYEIGYSHAIGKPTILLCDKIREKLPFDISGFRTLFYENTIAGKKKVENSLMKYLENI